MPDGINEKIKPQRATPVRPSDAASLIVLRGSGDKLEVLLGQRRKDARFAPGVYVFPAGASTARMERTPAFILFGMMSPKKSAAIVHNIAPTLWPGPPYEKPGKKQVCLLGNLAPLKTQPCHLCTQPMLTPAYRPASTN
jgi:hypothetical protein